MFTMHTLLSHAGLIHALCGLAAPHRLAIQKRSLRNGFPFYHSDLSTGRCPRPLLGSASTTSCSVLRRSCGRCSFPMQPMQAMHPMRRAPSQPTRTHATHAGDAPHVCLWFALCVNCSKSRVRGQTLRFTPETFNLSTIITLHSTV